MSDGWLYANWVVGSRVRAIDPGWPAAGCRIHHSFGVWPPVIDDGPSSFLGAVPGERLHLRGAGVADGRGAGPAVHQEQLSGSCLVTIVEDAVAGPGLVVPRAARQAAIAVRNTEALRRLALIAEGRHREWTGTE